MIKSLYKILYLLIPVMVLSSCGKDEAVFIPDSPKGEISYFFDQLPPNPDYSVTFTGNQNFIFNSPNGMRIEIPQGSIINRDGSIVNGLVSLNIFEYIHISDFLLNQIETRVDNEIKTIPIGLRFEMFNNQDVVHFSDEALIKISIPASEELMDDYKICSVKENENNTIAWTAIENTKYEIQKWYGNWSYEGKEYNGIHLQGNVGNMVGLYLPSAGDGTKKISPCVKLPEIFASQNTKVMLVQGKTNTVINLLPLEEDSYFCVPSEEIILGQEMDIVVISALTENEFYFDIKNAYAVENISLTIVPERKSILEILDILGMF